MHLSEQLGVRRGVTSIVGSGGKTTLMLTLAAQLPGRVIVTTTTKILPPQLPVCNPQTAAELDAALSRHGRLCVGAPFGGKLAASALPVAVLAHCCDYLLVEADGSRGLPLKAHLPHEPVIPSETRQRILVVGASGIGGIIAAQAHRPERFAALAGCAVEDAATPARIARVLRAEALFDTVVVNQAAHCMDEARQLAALLPSPVFAGEIREERLECLW